MNTLLAPEHSADRSPRTEAADRLSQWWDNCEALLNPAEVATLWLTGQLPRPLRTRRWAEGVIAVRNETRAAIEQGYLKALDRPPTEAEWADLFDPADQLFTLPDGVVLRRAWAAAFFPDLHQACGGELSRRELLQLATAWHAPESTANLAPELAKRFKQRLGAMVCHIANARNTPPVPEDWSALYELAGC